MLVLEKANLRCLQEKLDKTKDNLLSIYIVIVVNNEDSDCVCYGFEFCKSHVFAA